MEVGRTVSIGDEGTIFPYFPPFGYIFWYAVVLGLHVRVRAYCWSFVFLKYMFTAVLKFGKAPAPTKERRGDGDGCASSLCSPFRYIRHCPLVPVQPQSAELPATTEGVAETPLLARTQGRTADCTLTSLHHAPLQGGFFSVSLREVQQDCGDHRGHRSKP